jgi:hypothetical protein
MNITIHKEEYNFEIGTTNDIDLGDGLILSATLKSSDALYRDPHWLNTMYTENGMSMALIANICGVTPMTIQNWLAKHGIQTRRRGYAAKSE